MISGRWTEIGVTSTALLILLFSTGFAAADSNGTGGNDAGAIAADANSAIAPAAMTPEQVESIIQGIDTPRDTPIPFVERRTSRILTEPLTLNGEILFTTDGTLSKRVGEPFDEHITISAQRIELRRKDKTRHLSLDRRPDIKAFYVGMQALLAGDASALFESFDVTATENADGWSLDLAPKEKKLRKFVARLVISGEAAQVQTVRTEQPGGDWQEMSFHTTTN